MRKPTRFAIGFLAALCLVGVVAYFVGGFDWLGFVAAAGTALGTLGLAFYTYVLASATFEAEQHTQALVEAGQAQADAAKRQIEFSAEQLSIAQQTAVEAARARIDASAPLVALTVAQSGFWLETAAEMAPELREQCWTEMELQDVALTTTLGIRLTNYGASPALVAFPSLPHELERLTARSGGSRQFVLSPGERYEDSIPMRIKGSDLIEPIRCEVVFTYSSFLHGAMFDTVRWGGWLQPLRLVDGVAKRNDQIPLNAAPAQIVREYPALERPEEMHRLREQIRLGTGTSET